MKAEISEEQILDAVRSVIDEELPDAVRPVVLAHADSVIKATVAARIGPMVDEMLTDGQFVTSRWDDQKTPLDELVRRAVGTYLDERVFLYSASNDTPSGRVHRSSGGSSDPTRLEAFIRFSIERFCDERLSEKLKPIVASFITERGGIETVARQQMAVLLKDKFKL